MQQCYLSFLTSLHHLLQLATIRLCSCIFQQTSIHCPTWQIPPFSSITYNSFVPQRCSFPQTVLKCIFSSLSAAVCLILSVTYCFYTLLCHLQTVLASEFCCKSGPLSWTLWDHLEPPGHCWFQIYDYIWRHCQFILLLLHIKYLSVNFIRMYNFVVVY